MPLPVPVNGTISLQGPARQGVSPQPLTKRAMIIRMSEETLEALAAYPTHPPLQVQFGDKPGIHIASTFFPMQGGRESTPHELYLRAAPASKINAPLKLYADIAGKYTVDRELNGKIESRVQQSTADAKKTKSERRIVVLEAPPALASSATKTKSSAPAKKRKTAVSAPIATTIRRVPHVIRAKNEGSSAATGQSPPHSLPSSSPVSPAIRAQMIHLLAKGPRTKEDVITQISGPDVSETLRMQLNELLVTIAERERKTAVPDQPSRYTLLAKYWKEVRPYEFPGLTDDERRKMWRHARQFLHSLGIPESDPAWDHVRTLPGSTVTGPSKTGTESKRPTGAVSGERKKNAGGTSKAPVEAKDERVHLSQTIKVRGEGTQASRSTKTAPKREDDDSASSRLVSGPRNARETAPSQSQSQAQGPSKKVGLADARAKPSKLNGRPGLAAPIQPSSPHERELDKERPTHVKRKPREDGSDMDRDKGRPAPAPKAKRRRDDASDLDSLRDWDGADAVGKANPKKKKMREDHGDKERVNGNGNTIKRRKTVDDDGPYKPGGGGTKGRDRDRDKEVERAQIKARDRDSVPMAKRPRDSDRTSPDALPLPRKSTGRDRDRQRDREPDRSVSPLGHVKREPSLSPALHNSHQRESSPPVRASIKRTDTPPREVVKREESSPRPRGHSGRGDSPSAPRASKRAPSPPHSQPRTRDRDRDRESSTNGVSTTRRRRSPIYTSSEDEQSNAPVRRNNAPSSVTSSSSSREPGRPQGYASLPAPPTAPYPKDREALQARYRSGYRNYIAVYYQMSEERAKIQDALEGLGRDGSVCSDRDVEMMDEEGLRELASRYEAWTRELEGIRNSYSAEAERMDIETS